MIRVLPGAGPLTEIEGFWIRDGRATGPGGGIYCEAPAAIRGNFILDNRASGPGARGGGIFARAGARIIDNWIRGNHVTSSDPHEDVWSTDEETGGVGGGVFCLDCWVEGNHIENNVAPSAAGIVADGVVLGNETGWNHAQDGPWLFGAVRGEIVANRFDNCCGTGVPYLLVEGPSFLLRNIITDNLRPMCGPIDDIHLKGSMELIENIFGNVGIQACLCTDAVREPRPGHFRMERNYFAGWLGQGVHLHLDREEGNCPEPGRMEPQEGIPSDSIDFSCNVSDHIEFWYHRLGRDIPCVDCVFQLDHLPEGCPDTVPSFEYGCHIVPVVVQSWGLEPTAAGVRLFWTISDDLYPDGFDIERECSGRSERLTAERIAPCHSCEYIDPTPPAGAPSRYILLVYAGSQEPFVITLGTYDPSARSQPELALELPSPHPVRDRAIFRFTLPAGASPIRLDILDVQGRIIAVVREGFLPSGSQSVAWEARDGRGRPLAAGVYAVRLSTRVGERVRKILVLR